MYNIIMKRLFFVVFFLIGNLYAYSFGKNKLQTRDYNFQVFETSHFRIFSYLEDQFIIDFAGSVLEEAYEEYVSTLGVKVEQKIPVIVYNSPKHFSETNVITDIIDEGIGGFTEIFKNRMVIPFTGSYKDFRHVLRHELVHVFQYAMLKRRTASTLESILVSQVPLWAIEGMAEYLSIGWSSDADRYIRDLILSNKLVDLVSLNYYGGYIVYKMGQLFYRYVEEVYGREKISEFFSLLIYTNSVDRAFRRSFGLSQKDFDKRFNDYIRRQFYINIGSMQTPVNLKRFTDREKIGNYYNVAPAITADGSQVYFIQEKLGNFYIVKHSVITGERLAVVFKSSRIPSFENIHILRPSLSITSDGRYLVFAAQTGEGDQIYILDTKRNRLKGSIKYNLDAIYTPNVSEDGRKIVFVGLKDGKSDLYLYDLTNKNLIRLTDDIYDDMEPSFDNNGNVIFVSDRLEESEHDFTYGTYAVFSKNLTTGEINRLSDYYEEVYSPKMLGDSILLYVASDGFSALNLYRIDLNTGNAAKITDFATELRWYSISKKGRIIAAILYNNGYDIFDIKETSIFPDSSRVLSRYKFPRSSVVSKVKKYTPRFTADWLYGTAGYSSFTGFQGSVTLGVSDELGDYQFQIFSDLSGDLVNSNFELDFYNLKGRIKKGFSFYQLWDVYYVAYDTVVASRTLGLFLSQILPHSRSRRTELGISAELQSDYYYWQTPLGNFIELEELYQTKSLLGLYFGHVFDNVYYNYIADPIKGVRYYAGVFRSFPYETDLGILVADFRHYFAFNENYIWANRLKMMKSFGKDRYLFTFDGISDLRSVYWGDVVGDKYAIFNSEFRFPFVKRLSLGFPLPIEISNIGGVLFFDAGVCTFKPFHEIQIFDDFHKLKDVNADLGYGLRLWLGFAKLKVDFVHETDFRKVTGLSKINFSLGFDF